MHVGGRHSDADLLYHTSIPFQQLRRRLCKIYRYVHWTDSKNSPEISGSFWNDPCQRRRDRKAELCRYLLKEEYTCNRCPRHNVLWRPYCRRSCRYKTKERFALGVRIRDHQRPAGWRESHPRLSANTARTDGVTRKGADRTCPSSWNQAMARSSRRCVQLS